MSTTDKKSQLAFFFSLLAIVLIIGGALTSYYLGKERGKKEAAAPIPIIDLSANQPLIKGVSVLNADGTILSIEKDRIILLSPAKDKNGEWYNRKITALISSVTKFEKLDLTNPPVPHESTTKEIISLSDLKSGDRLVIQSDNEINNQQEILAKTVQLIATP